jgi:hypothetical protein
VGRAEARAAGQRHAAQQVSGPPVSGEAGARPSTEIGAVLGAGVVMASASSAHIFSYSASVSAIIALVWARQFVVASDASFARLVLIISGGTIAARANSWAHAAAAA